MKLTKKEQKKLKTSNVSPNVHQEQQEQKKPKTSNNSPKVIKYECRELACNLNRRDVPGAKANQKCKICKKPLVQKSGFEELVSTFSNLFQNV
jgi:hypothetical protein